LDEADGSHVPGEIVPSDQFIVATLDSLIEIQQIQPAGKRQMTGGEFLRGHNPPAGSLLG